MIPKIKVLMSTNQQKKTNYPDLERLPPTNFWKHLLNWAWNKPRIIIEQLYYNYFTRPKVELEQIKLELEMKNFQLKQLEAEADIKRIQEDHNILLERFKS